LLNYGNFGGNMNDKQKEYSDFMLKIGPFPQGEKLDRLIAYIKQNPKSIEFLDSATFMQNFRLIFLTMQQGVQAIYKEKEGILSEQEIKTGILDTVTELTAIMNAKYEQYRNQKD